MARTSTAANPATERNFGSLELLPPDPILGLSAAFAKDPRTDKINLASGVYIDETGRTPVFASVRAAEARLVEDAPNKVYLPIEGPAGYVECVQDLLFERNEPVRREGRLRTVQAVGGTGALRIAVELIRRVNPGAAVWVSDPTWPNHPGIVTAAGLKVRRYPVWDPSTGRADPMATVAALEQAAPGDAVILQACCHNPTGADPDGEGWQVILDAVVRNRLRAIFDFAYQGFARSVGADANVLAAAEARGMEFLVASSFSKNLGLYAERVGALSLVAGNGEAAARAFSQMQNIVRTLWSNPPAQGARLVMTVLQDPDLRVLWLRELDGQRERLAGMRRALAAALRERGVDGWSQALPHQVGMFSLTGLGAGAVRKLREAHGLYLVETGRINVAALRRANLDRVAELLAMAGRR